MRLLEKDQNVGEKTGLVFSFCMNEGEGKICEYVTVIVYQNNEPRIGHCQL